MMTNYWYMTDTSCEMLNFVTLWYYVAAFDKATSAKASFDKHQVYSYKAYAIMLT